MVVVLVCGCGWCGVAVAEAAPAVTAEALSFRQTPLSSVVAPSASTDHPALLAPRAPTPPSLLPPTAAYTQEDIKCPYTPHTGGSQPCWCTLQLERHSMLLLGHLKSSSSSNSTSNRRPFSSRPYTPTSISTSPPNPFEPSSINLA